MTSEPTISDARQARRDRRLARMHARAFAKTVLCLFVGIAIFAMIHAYGAQLGALGAAPLVVALMAMAARVMGSIETALRRPSRPPKVRSGTLGSAAPLGRADSVVVYTALYGPNTRTALRVLREAGCDPAPLYEPFVPHVLPAIAAIDRYPIAIPAAQVDAARDALRAWRDRNVDCFAACRDGLTRRIVRVAALVALMLVTPVLWQIVLFHTDNSWIIFWALQAYLTVLAISAWSMYGWRKRHGRRRAAFDTAAGLFCHVCGIAYLRGDLAPRPDPDAAG
jgi:hypothetical protein